MKLGFISDLHFDLNSKNPPQQYLDILNSMIKKKNLDYLVFCGDISEHYTLTFNFVEMLERKSGIKIYFIPGNHDYYTEKYTNDTWETYHILRKHPQCLLESPVKLNNQYTLVGHSAWYDHTIRHENYTAEEAEKGVFEGHTIADKRYINWKQSDKSVSDYFSKIIENDFESSDSDNFILVTHMVTNSQVFDKSVVAPYLYAYGGTNDILPIYSKYNITHSIMGHYHQRIEFEQNGTNFVCCSLGYPHEWKTNFLDEEIEDAVYILEI